MILDVGRAMQVPGEDAALTALARAVVPALAELCVVDAFRSSGEARRLVMIHADPGKLEFMRDSQRRYPPTTRHPIFDVFRSGQAQLVADVPDALLERMAFDATHLAILRISGPKSLIMIPIHLRGRVIAVVSLVITASDYRYDAADFEAACEVAYRASRVLQGSVIPPA